MLCTFYLFLFCFVFLDAKELSHSEIFQVSTYCRCLTLACQFLFFLGCTVGVITFYSPSFLSQETAKESFYLRVKQLPPAPLSTTHGGDFTHSRFNAKRQAQKLLIPIFMFFSLT